MTSHDDKTKQSTTDGHNHVVLSQLDSNTWYWCEPAGVEIGVHLDDVTGLFGVYVDDVQMEDEPVKEFFTLEEARAFIEKSANDVPEGLEGVCDNHSRDCGCTDSPKPEKSISQLRTENYYLWEILAECRKILDRETINNSPMEDYEVQVEFLRNRIDHFERDMS